MIIKIGIEKQIKRKQFTLKQVVFGRKSSLQMKNCPFLITLFQLVYCADSVLYSYTGSQQSFTVPVGAVTMTIDMYGARGGGGNTYGGKGARVQAVLNVVGGTTYNYNIGGKGADSMNGGSVAGGFNGGNLHHTML